MELKKISTHGGITRWESQSGPRVVLECERWIRRGTGRERFHKSEYSAWAGGTYLGKFKTREAAMTAIQNQLKGH